MEKKKNIFSRIVSSKEGGVFLALIAIIMITTIGNSAFVSYANVNNLLRSISLTFIGAVGMMFVLSTGAFDLSVGATYGFVGIVTGLMITKAGIPYGLAIIIGLAVGALIGLVNGVIICKCHIPPLITTLGMQYIVRGMINVITQGRPVTGMTKGFNQIGQGGIGILPYTALFAAVVFIIAAYVFKYTVYGRSVLAVGGNKETARVSGINVDRVAISTYVIAGLLAGLVGILTASRLSSAQSNAGTNWEMTLIASAVIGGTSLAGGIATTLGTLIGVAIMESLNVMTTLLKIDTYYQKVIIGVIIIIAVGIDVARRNKMARG
jgi:ribose/xylose/arabinose/galactoside ABC-type transport system permease subunit